MIDLGRHEKTLKAMVPELGAVMVDYAMERMRFGALKHEKPGMVDVGRDFVAEGIEELIDGINRLVMEHDRRVATGRPVDGLAAAANLVRGAVETLKDVRGKA